MVDTVKESAWLICLPWERRLRIKGMPEHLKRQCALCKGYVCVNPATFESKGVPANLTPVCGACALDVMEADGGADSHDFQLTDAQKEGRGSLLVKAAIAAAGKNWPKQAIEKLRAERDYYDASKSAPVEGAN